MSKKVSRVSAYGLLLQNDKLLLCRLSQRVMKSAGHWTLPGGGLDFGETPEDAMVREFREETGLIVKPGHLVGIDTLCDEVNGTQFHNLRIIYEAHYVDGDLIYEQDGTTDLCKWFSEAETLEETLVGLARTGVRHAFNQQV